MKDALISVIIPVYNTASYLSECLDSIFTSQTFRNFVVLCCDDCSTDESPEILARYAKRYPQQMTIIRHEQNRGAAAALNTLMRIVDSPYMTFCDSDDIMHCERLQRVFNFLEQNKDIDIVGSWMTFFKHRFPSKYLHVYRCFADDYTIRSLMLFTNSMTGPLVTIRTASLRAANVWQNEQLKSPAAHDYDFIVRLAPHFRFAIIPESLYYYRMHSRQASMAGKDQQLHSALEIAQRHLGQFGVRVSQDALRILLTKKRISLFHFVSKFKKEVKQAKQMIADVKNITDFYSYPCVSPSVIANVSSWIQPRLHTRLLVDLIGFCRALVDNVPTIRWVVRRYPIISFAYKTAQALRRISRNR